MDNLEQGRARIKRIGRAMLQLGLQNTHSGNISMRLGDQMLITKSGSMKGHLEDRDICNPGLNEPGYGLFQSSSETGGHRRVLQYAGSLVHAHAPAAVSLSFLLDEIRPLDALGAGVLPEVPVINPRDPVGSAELEDAVAEILRHKPALVVRGHGPFVRGENPEAAFYHLCLLENSCRLILDLLLMGVDIPSLYGSIRVAEVESPDFSPEQEHAGVDPVLLKQFRRTAVDLFQLRLSPFTSGSLSVRDGPDMIYAPFLASPDGCELRTRRLSLKTAFKCRFMAMHAAGYQATAAKAILFTHTPEALAQGFSVLAAGRRDIVPADAEGLYFYPGIPVLAATAEPGEVIAQADRCKMVLINGEGILALGHTPGHVIHHNSSAQSICRYLNSLAVMTRTGLRPKTPSQLGGDRAKPLAE